jgi:hypothetical protein
MAQQTQFLRIRTISPALLAAALLTGCHHQYRLLDADLVPIKQPLPSRRAVVLPLPMIEHNPGYDEAYIEFNDQGRLFDPKPDWIQVQKTLDLIDRNKYKNIVLYVHGWNNNASEESADVTRFRFALSYLSQKLEPNNDLLGVFIGWRGGTFKGGVLGPFTFLTYWSRKEGAKLVGKGDLTEVIDTLVARTQAVQPGRRFYAVGHSFGARVLEQALQKSSHFEAFYDALEQGQTDVALPIDLVLLINPATDSRLTEKLIDRANRLNRGKDLIISHPGYDPVKCRQDPNLRICKPYPLMVEMASVGDYLTGAVMPVANVVNWVPPFLLLADPSARVLSAPFTPTLHTHQIKSCGYGNDPCGAADPKTEFDFDMPAVPQKNAQSYWERLERIDGQKSPFVWIMTCDTHMSLNHGDVWNGNIAAMMFALIDPKGPQKSTQAPPPSLPPPPPPPPQENRSLTEAEAPAPPPPAPKSATEQKRPGLRREGQL